MFWIVVAAPALRAAGAPATALQRQCVLLVWAGLAATSISGIVWFLATAATISGLPYRETMTADVLPVVLTETQFGLVAEIRFALALVLAACLAYDRSTRTRWLALAAGLGLMAAIAWTGHGGSDIGVAGLLHAAADVLHLVASAAWIGGLVPLALLLAELQRNSDGAGDAIVQRLVQRFSVLGVISVATLLVTGIINAWALVGSFDALAATDYGRILMLKIVLFAMMVGVAAINRFWLTPRLALPAGSPMDALREITRNSMIELALGLAIFAIVGALGMMHPAIHSGG